MKQENRDWDRFVSSGKVEDYLTYAVSQRHQEDKENTNREGPLESKGNREETCRNLLL